MQPVYITLLALCKASMLCFFLRILPTQFMQWLSKIALGFVIAWNIACVFASIFLCNPVSAQWTGQGKCGAYIPFIQSLIATNAVGDIIIMALPMHSLWNLLERTVEKLATMSCFGLGTIDFGSHTGNAKRSKADYHSDQHSTWELNSYRPHRDGKHNVEVFKIDDESACQRNLTAASALDDAIRVQTAWTVRHD
ncbi:hypothetical protein FALCPG4_002461 [Fusarium falciforme]